MHYWQVYKQRSISLQKLRCWQIQRFGRPTEEAVAAVKTVVQVNADNNLEAQASSKNCSTGKCRKN